MRMEGAMKIEGDELWKSGEKENRGKSVEQWAQISYQVPGAVIRLASIPQPRQKRVLSLLSFAFFSS